MLDSCIDSWQSGIGFGSLHLWDAFSFEHVRINLPPGLQTISWLLAAFVWCFLSLPKVRVGVITLSFRYHGMGKKGILSKGWVYTLFLLVRSPESQWLKPKPEGETMNKEPGDSYAKHIYRNGVAERSFQHLDSGFGGNGRPETWVWLLVWYPVEFHYGNPTRNMCFFPSSWQVEDLENWGTVSDRFIFDWDSWLGSWLEQVVILKAHDSVIFVKCLNIWKQSMKQILFKVLSFWLWSPPIFFLRIGNLGGGNSNIFMGWFNHQLENVVFRTQRANAWYRSELKTKMRWIWPPTPENWGNWNLSFLPTPHQSILKKTCKQNKCRFGGMIFRRWKIGNFWVPFCKWIHVEFLDASRYRGS